MRLAAGQAELRNRSPPCSFIVCWDFWRNEAASDTSLDSSSVMLRLIARIAFTMGIWIVINVIDERNNGAVCTRLKAYAFHGESLTMGEECPEDSRQFSQHSKRHNVAKVCHITSLLKSYDIFVCALCWGAFSFHSAILCVVVTKCNIAVWIFRVWNEIWKLQQTRDF